MNKKKKKRGPNIQPERYKVRKVARRNVKLDEDVYYDPKILHSTLYLDSDRIVVRDRKGGKRFALARYVMKAKEGQIVDHQNRNLFDNRRENLRIATARQNVLNRRLRSNTGYIGVSKTRKGKNYNCYNASFRPKEGKRKYFCSPATAKGLILAALARDKFVLEAGDEEFAPLNFECFKYEPFRSCLLGSDLDEYKQPIGENDTAPVR
jgi:hypothetical protein